MVRPQLNEVLGHVVHARLAMETLHAVILEEMGAGYRPTYRGHPWTREHYEVLDAASVGLEATFDMLKWVQFPEATFRRVDALQRIETALLATRKEITYVDRNHRHPRNVDRLPS